MDFEQVNQHFEELREMLKYQVTTWINVERDKLQAQELCKYLEANFGGSYEPFPDFAVSHTSVVIAIRPKTAKHLGFYLRRLRQLGLTRTTQHVESTATPEWIFRSKEDIRVVFIADFTGNANDPNACRMVEVETKTVEQPVMKLVCPDGSDVQTYATEEEPAA